MAKTLIIPVKASAADQQVVVTIPDPVATIITTKVDDQTVQNKINVTQADATYVITGGAQPPDIEPIVYTLSRLNSDTPNCGRQMCDFGTPSFTYNSKSIYDRNSWAQLQTSHSTLNTQLLKNLFEKVKAKKQTVNFRLGMFDSGGTYGSTPINGFQCFYPAFVHTIMQGETIKDWNNGKIWFPNWNSKGMQTEWANFIQLLVAWLKQNNYYQMIDFIDISGYGDYESEWHMYGFESLETSNKTKIGDDAQIFFIDTNMKNFNDIPNIGNQALFDNRYASDKVAAYAATVKNDYGLMGFRNDHLAWTSVIAADKQRMNRVVNGINLLDEYNLRYKVSPMIGEPMNSASAVTPSGGTPYQTMQNDITDFGMCQFENKSVVTTAQAQTNYMNAVKAIGLLGIDTLTVNKDGSYSIKYFNTGKPGLYWPWTVNVIADGVIVDKIPVGAKSISIKLTDPKGYREPFFLANTGRASDGSYKIGDVK